MKNLSLKGINTFEKKKVYYENKNFRTIYYSRPFYLSWEAIIEEWGGKLTRDAIADAVHLAREALSVYDPEISTGFACT